MNVEELLKPLVENFNVDFYDTQIVKEDANSIFRVFVTSKDGITLEKCAEISNAISPILDTNPPIKDKYFLEVSSPGLERKLSTKEHYAHAIGELVKVTTYEKDKIKGKLLALNEDSIDLEIKDETLNLKFEDIKKARTYIQWN
jgi:ribosome maturation factor RimP